MSIMFIEEKTPLLTWCAVSWFSSFIITNNDKLLSTNKDYLQSSLAFSPLDFVCGTTTASWTSPSSPRTESRSLLTSSLLSRLLSTLNIIEYMQKGLWQHHRPSSPHTKNAQTVVQSRPHSVSFLSAKQARLVQSKKIWCTTRPLCNINW